MAESTLSSLASLLKTNNPQQAQGVTGNAATNTATMVPNLNAFGQDPMLSMSGNLSYPTQGKHFQTQIQKSELVFAEALNITQPNIKFDWTPSNATILDEYHMLLAIKVRFKLGDGSIPTKSGLFPTLHDLPSDLFDWEGGLWPDFAWMQLFNRASLRIGQQLFEEGPFFNGDIGLIKYNAGWQSYSPEKLKEIVKFGTPWSQPLGSKAPVDLSSVTNVNSYCSNMSFGNPEYRKAYGNYLRELYNSWFVQSCTASGLWAGAASEVIMPIQFPLRQLRKFFDNEGILPSATKMSLMLTMNLNWIEIGRWGCALNSTMASMPPSNANPLIMEVQPVFNDPMTRLLYYEYRLPPQLQNSLNLRFMNEPVVYLNTCFQVSPSPPLETAGINFQIQQSSEQPTLIRLIIVNSDPIGSAPDTSVPLICQAGPYRKTYYTNYPGAKAGGFIWSDIRIQTTSQADVVLPLITSLQSRLGQQYQFDEPQLNFLKQYHPYQYTFGLEEYDCKSSGNGYYEGPELRICLDPTQKPQLGDQAIDPGPVNISITAKITRQDGSPAGSKYIVHCVRQYSYQTVINATGSAGDINYPASALGGGRVLITNTANQSAASATPAAGFSVG